MLKNKSGVKLIAYVVNCFQNTILVVDSQVNYVENKEVVSCELLSEYYFSSGFAGPFL